MTVYKCDRCKKEINNYEMIIIRAFRNLDAVDDQNKGMTYHFCYKCASDVQKFMENRT